MDDLYNIHFWRWIDNWRVTYIHVLSQYKYYYDSIILLSFINQSFYLFMDFINSSISTVLMIILASFQNIGLFPPILFLQNIYYLIW